jgi:hypothetical protein
MKTSYEIKQNIQSHVESCIQDNKDSIIEAFEATKDNESITLIEYLEELIEETSCNYGNDCNTYPQDSWDIVYAFKFADRYDQDYYFNACDNSTYEDFDKKIEEIAYLIASTIFRELLEESLYKYEQQKLMQVA